jgi:hypothetical protein
MTTILVIVVLARALEAEAIITTTADVGRQTMPRPYRSNEGPSLRFYEVTR